MQQKTVFTRRELYDLVWKKPVETLAAEFGMSGRGLGKLCERYSIPVPPRGYWARAGSGKRVSRPPLLEIDGITEEEKISFRLPAIDKAQASQTTAQPYKDMWLRQIADIPPILVPAKLSRPHPLIERILAEEKREELRYPRSSIFSGFIKSKEEIEFGRRRLRILDALFKTMTGMKLSIHCEPNRSSPITVQFAHDKVEFELKEYIRQYRRPLTDQERANSWSASQQWTQVKEPTGKATLKIKSWMPKGVPDEFRETDETPIDTKLHEALAAIVVALAHTKSKREERAEEERRYRENRERAAKAEQERKAEAARKTALRESAALWQEAKILRAYIQAVRTAVKTGNPLVELNRLEDWCSWALAHADEIDPLGQPKKEDGISGGRSDWLRFLKTYRTMCLAPSPEFRLVLQEVRDLRLAA